MKTFQRKVLNLPESVLCQGELLQLQSAAAKTSWSRVYEETLIFQNENFGIMIQGKGAPSLGELLDGFILTNALQKEGDVIT